MKVRRVKPEILAQQPRIDGRNFACKYDEPLTKRAYGARIPQSLEPKIKALPNMSEWIREVLIEAAEELPDVPESN